MEIAKAPARTRKSAPVRTPVVETALYAVTEEWRAAVLARLEELGMTLGELATNVGCDPSTISDLLTRKDRARRTTRSTLVPTVHRVLGWGPPTDNPALVQFAAVLAAIPDSKQAEAMEVALAAIEMFVANVRR